MGHHSHILSPADRSLKGDLGSRARSQSRFNYQGCLLASVLAWQTQVFGNAVAVIVIVHLLVYWNHRAVIRHYYEREILELKKDASKPK